MQKQLHNLNKIKGLTVILLSLILVFVVLNPSSVSACACGCWVFNVGTGSLIPNCLGGTAFLQYDRLNQSKNFSGSKASNLVLANAGAS